MQNPQQELYSILSSLGCACSQGYQSIFNEVPAITFVVGKNVPRYNLDKTVIAYEIEATIDIWADESTTLSYIADKVESVMRDNDYLLSHSTDVLAPEECLCHYQMRFDAIKP